MTFCEVGAILNDQPVTTISDDLKGLKGKSILLSSKKRWFLFKAERKAKAIYLSFFLEEMDEGMPAINAEQVETTRKKKSGDTSKLLAY